MRPPHPALVALPLACCCSCTTLQPVLRYPWVEDRHIALEDETLVVTVGPDEVEVDARLHFRQVSGSPHDRILTFPIPAAGACVRSFCAQALRPGFAPVTLPVSPSTAGWLPAGDASLTFDVLVGANLLQGDGSVLRFRYRQVASRLFRYTLKTGAYWAGPIDRLEVFVIDPGNRVARATTEGRQPDRVQSSLLSWTFLHLEPDQGMALEVAR